jgi:hypothetical protein
VFCVAVGGGDAAARSNPPTSAIHLQAAEVPTLLLLVFVSAGAAMGCGAEALTIVSMLSVPSVFFRPPDRAEESGQWDDFTSGPISGPVDASC